MPAHEEQLLQAAAAGDLAGVLAVLATGADVKDCTEAAVQAAASNGYVSVVRCLLTYGQHNALWLALEKGLLDVAQLFRTAAPDADVHTQDAGFLHKAARKGHLAVVQCLIDAGADVHAETDRALRWAARKGHLAIVQCLLAAGADVRADDDYALFWAAHCGHATVVQLLLAHGANLAPVMPRLQEFQEEVQVAVLKHGDISALSPTDLARQGICAAALCVLIDRLGKTDLSAMLHTTQMLDSLEPEARAILLAELLPSRPQTETAPSPATAAG